MRDRRFMVDGVSANAITGVLYSFIVHLPCMRTNIYAIWSLPCISADTHLSLWLQAAWQHTQHALVERSSLRAEVLIDVYRRRHGGSETSNTGIQITGSSNYSWISSARYSQGGSHWKRRLRGLALNTNTIGLGQSRGLGPLISLRFRCSEATYASYSTGISS